MSDEDTTHDTDAPDNPDTDDVNDEPGRDDEPFDPDRAKEKIRRQNSENASLRKRLREAEAKARKLDELEDQGKSETQRLNEANRSLDERARNAEREAARLRVAIRKGLTEAQAKRLVGDTEEDLEADADELLASFQNSDDPAPGGRPKERLRPGAIPNAEPEPDVSDVVGKIRRGF